MPEPTYSTQESIWNQAAQSMIRSLTRDIHNHLILGDPWQNAVVNMIHVQKNMINKIQRPRVYQKRQPPTTWDAAARDMIQRLMSRVQTRRVQGTWLSWANDRAATPHRWTHRNADVRFA